MRNIVLILLILLGLVGNGCVTMMVKKHSEAQTKIEKVEQETTTVKKLDFTDNYVAVEFSTEKYKNAPVMRVNRYNDGTAIISLDKGNDRGIYGICSYGVTGQVILYTGSESMRTTYANAEISVFENRVTLTLNYPMGETEIIVLERVYK